MVPRREVIGAAAAVLAQMLFAACASLEAASTSVSSISYAPGARQFAVDGSLSPKEYAVLKGLEWPQTLADMRGSFGSPAHAAGHEEFFFLDSDKTRYVVVSYNGDKAIGFYEVFKRE